MSNYVGAQGVYAREDGEEITHLLKNGHGDVVAKVTDGAVTGTYTYDAFGNEKAPDAADTNPFRYCGEYTDAESGSVYLRNRYYDPRTGRFTQEDPIRDGGNWYVYCANNPVMFVDPTGLENIVVSGSEYDSGRYKYNFIEPAIKKIAELATVDPDESLTWVVSQVGYSDDAIEKFKDVADYYGVNIVFITSADELVNYINSKDVTSSTLTKARTNDKIRKFAVFSHGVPGMVPLGYNQGDAGIPLQLTKEKVDNIHSNAFYEPNSAFYSCNTGTGGNNSFAQYWVNKVGGRTWAAVGTTFYGDMNIGESWSNKIDRMMTGFNPFGSRNYPVASSGAYFTNFYRQ